MRAIASGLAAARRRPLPRLRDGGGDPI